MKHQFKEGDGSHRDMTIEQCNLVLDRLRKQGYRIYSRIATEEYPSFLFDDEHEFVSCWNNHPRITNQIPFERWMEILDQNEAKEKAVSIATNAIKDHQWKCRIILEYGGIEEYKIHVNKECAKDIIDNIDLRNNILYELKEDIKHINFDQYAGYSRIILEKVKQLTSF